MKADGTIDKYKARLVVKGFKQKEGLDYFDTYSSVTRITLIRMLITLAAVYGLEIHQMGVKTAFLNGELEEESYMEEPQGFVVPRKENKINECDKCVYIKDTLNHQVIVCLYVDDMLIISRDISDINTTKRMLKSKFDMKDLGVVDVILGIRIHKTPQMLALSQSYYIKKVLDKFKYIEFGIAKTPLDVSFALQKNEGESDSQLEELLSSEIITVDYVKSKDNVLDPLTKGLSREEVEKTSKEMGLRPRTEGVRAGTKAAAVACVASAIPTFQMHAELVLLAEKEAWSYAKQRGKDMVTMLPTLVIGSMLQKTTNASNLVLIKLLKGEKWLKWIDIYIITIQFFVSVNGEPVVFRSTKSFQVREPEKERADLKDQNESAVAEEFAEEAALDAYDITLERIKEE
ncbi:hypothetical protein T459_21434 [Capsicum annuum]|uniref:Reverse transcriptase Ty1/copia-type domain-containing protein n=1 Tax=Capsicum annuum TaxID=4072 RepID=A0A2G2YWL2_CAPAN|nr:hypothetical protein T459_21434 [Capsicum annuum]